MTHMIYVAKDMNNNNHTLSISSKLNNSTKIYHTGIYTVTNMNRYNNNNKRHPGRTFPPHKVRSSNLTSSSPPRPMQGTCPKTSSRRQCRKKNDSTCVRTTCRSTSTQFWTSRNWPTWDIAVSLIKQWEVPLRFYFPSQWSTPSQPSTTSPGTIRRWSGTLSCLGALGSCGIRHAKIRNWYILSSSTSISVNIRMRT